MLKKKINSIFSIFKVYKDKAFNFREIYIKRFFIESIFFFQIDIF